MMRAVQFSGPEMISMVSVPDPSCADDEVVVQVAVTGLCGTDVHIYRNEYMSRFPIIAGHEFCGTIVETGKAVSELQVGERVAVDPNLYCGRCHFCRDEKASHCLNWEGIGITRPGSFAEYVAVPSRACYRLPDTLTDSQGALIEPVSCVIHALKRLRVMPGDEVLIFGAGPMGLVLVQALRHSGASQIAVVEKQPERLKMARELGATHSVLASDDEVRSLNELSPFGFAIVVDATGVPSVIERAFNYLKPGGQFLQFGVAPRNARVQLEPYLLFKNDWTILGSFALCYTFQPAISWLTNKMIDVAPLVSQTLPLDEFVSGFQDFAAGKTLKIHFRPGRSV
jgi:2-desacetyl-2-hydroxyethyl bacteriochlorophyllide A dehydrogenase